MFYVCAYRSGLCLAVISAKRKRAEQLCSYSDKQNSSCRTACVAHIIGYWMDSGIIVLLCYSCH